MSLELPLSLSLPSLYSSTLPCKLYCLSLPQVLSPLRKTTGFCLGSPLPELQPGNSLQVLFRAIAGPTSFVSFSLGLLSCTVCVQCLIEFSNSGLKITSITNSGFPSHAILLGTFSIGIHGNSILLNP